MKEKIEQDIEAIPLRSAGFSSFYCTLYLMAGAEQGVEAVSLIEGSLSSLSEDSSHCKRYERK